MIPAAQRAVYICPPCRRAIDARLGVPTTASALAAAESHGCVLQRKPRDVKFRFWVKFYLPRLGTPEEWAKVWDSLDGRMTSPPLCRRGCGHPESIHQFSTLIQDDCALNCSRCRGMAG